MNPVTTGIVAAVAVIAAFAAGAMIEIDDDGVSLDSPIAADGPLEQIGEKLDEAAER